MIWACHTSRCRLLLTSRLSESDILTVLFDAVPTNEPQCLQRLMISRSTRNEPHPVLQRPSTSPQNPQNEKPFTQVDVVFDMEDSRRIHTRNYAWNRKRLICTPASRIESLQESGSIWRKQLRAHAPRKQKQYKTKSKSKTRKPPQKHTYEETDKSSSQS